MDLIFVRGTSWLDRIIERVTKSKYSHVSVYAGNGQVIEAQVFRPVRSLGLYYANCDVYRVSLTDYQKQRMLAYLQAHIGEQYDYLEIFFLFIRYLFGFKFPYRETRRVICSTLVRDALEYAGLPMTDGLVSPEDLIECPLVKEVT